MTDLSPMERAVRALASRLASHLPGVVPVAMGRVVIERLADLRTSDPDAFAAVLAECGVVTHSDGDAWAAMDDALDEALFRALGPTESRTGAVLKSLTTRGYHLVSEGQAVVEGRVVELEECKTVHISTVADPFGNVAALYRVKPERSDQRTEQRCPSCGGPDGHCRGPGVGFDRASDQRTEEGK